jgi:hypothetical protein
MYFFSDLERELKIPQHVLAVKALQSRSEVQCIVHVPAPFPSLALIHFPLCILLPHPILYNLGTLTPWAPWAPWIGSSYFSFPMI